MKTGSNVPPTLAAEMGLSAEEFDRAVAILGRTPNLTELGIFSAMWSEHCSYKSSKVWLRTLPTTGPRVICGPGETARVAAPRPPPPPPLTLDTPTPPPLTPPHQGAPTPAGAIPAAGSRPRQRPLAPLT